MTPTQQPDLWNRIRRFELDDPAAAFSFTDRLARENGWPLEYALRATLEYRKFMFLLCLTEHPLTPSDQVDPVWHLHLLYTRSYCWNSVSRYWNAPFTTALPAAATMSVASSTTGTAAPRRSTRRCLNKSRPPTFSLIMRLAFEM